jgi:hypothetical protein
MKEETLSDKINDGANTDGWHKVVYVEDVKEFIKKLKKDLCFCSEIETDEETPECSFCYSMRKLAGDKLIKEQEQDK